MVVAADSGGVDLDLIDVRQRRALRNVLSVRFVDHEGDRVMADDSRPLPFDLPKGGNIALRELGVELGSINVILESGGRIADTVVTADVSVLLLGEDGKVRGDSDLVFYNQPIALGGAVHLRDRVRTEPAEDAEIGDVISADVVTLELDDVPEDIHRIVLAASLDPTLGVTFKDAAVLSMRIQRSSDARDVLRFSIADCTSETALLFGEFYRRNAEWKIRAIGQGYDGGLAALVSDHGVQVEESATAADASDGGEVESSGPGTEGGGPGQTSEKPPARKVSVRRPTRPPRMPGEWQQTIPTVAGNDWQPARLFPVAGIGGNEEQERRATSSLLAVVSIVREFGRTLTARCGAPAGSIETFVEVPFAREEDAVRPDGVIRVTRGQRSWTALVEMKTLHNQLKQEQISNYLDVARAKNFDAVITISNELTGTEEGPINIDRRKLRRVRLVHLSWDRIRTDALMAARHTGVSDPTQRRILDEFIRYMSHPKAGLQGFTDMGPRWVTVRDGVRARTLRSTDRHTAEVSSRFDQLMQHLAFQFSAALGVDVQAVPPRNAADSATRYQQLADSGLLYGTLRVPGTVGPIVVSADVRVERLACSVQCDAPTESRNLTRVRWLLRQLPTTLRDSVRIESIVAGSRSASVARLMRAVRQDPGSLVPADNREIKAFKIVMEDAMGAKRAATPGGLITSIQALSHAFYVDVVQNLQPWTVKPPRLEADDSTI